MNIFLPFEIKDIGGTATFARNFSDAAKEKGIAVSDTFSLDFDTLFIIADCSLWQPIIAKILQKKIVQRLDGVYHPATPAGKWYPLYNLKMQIIHNYLADVVIYQSEFSRLCCEKFLGKSHAKQTTIIYNGIDTNKIPTKNISHVRGVPTRLLTFAKFRRRDQIEPIIESVKLLDSEKYTLDIYGSYSKNLNHLFENLPAHIRFQGKKLNEELLQVLHKYDIFLFSDQSACPNSVLEAMSAGLPIVAFNRGSIPELIKPGYNGEIANVRENSDSFMDIYPFERDQFIAFYNAIKRISEARNEYAVNCTREVTEKFILNSMIENYLNLLKR